jgi:uncharacterized protein (DUF2062 family)/SAM-dependent methyltransferase
MTTKSWEGAATGSASRMRQLVYGLRTEGTGPGREAAAIGLGLFIGCSPFYGLHFLICMAAGWLFRLNRLKVYVAANISNPIVAPFLLLAELQTGAFVRREQLQGLTLEAVKRMDPWQFAGDLLLGSVLVGAVLALAAGGATYALAREGHDDRFFLDLVRRAADRFVTSSITAWEFARGKLRGDPLYRTVLLHGLLPGGGTLVDVGCGSGLMLAMLVEARRADAAGEWPDDRRRPPLYQRLVGVEVRPRVARLARAALGADAVILEGDARDVMPPACDAVLFFDVLHMLPEADQDRILDVLADRLGDGGVMLVREADAAAGWRFLAVRAGNRLKAFAFGHWRQRFHFRSAGEWTRAFAARGFDVAAQATGQGTPFGNVLFVLTARERASGSSPRS